MDHLVPVRMHAKQNADEFQRVGELLGVQSAATAAIVDPPNTVREKLEGFVTPDDFIERVSRLLPKAK